MLSNNCQTDSASSEPSGGYLLNSKALSHSALITLSTYNVVTVESPDQTFSQNSSIPTEESEKDTVMLTHTLPNQPEHCEESSPAW